MPLTCRLQPSMRSNRTTDKPMALGRSGERVANRPRATRGPRGGVTCGAQEPPRCSQLMTHRRSKPTKSASADAGMRVASSCKTASSFESTADACCLLRCSETPFVRGAYPTNRRPRERALSLLCGIRRSHTIGLSDVAANIKRQRRVRSSAQ